MAKNLHKPHCTLIFNIKDINREKVQDLPETCFELA